MKIKPKRKKFKKLKNGDVFYLEVNTDLNNFLGEETDLTGSDMIFIKDDGGYLSPEKGEDIVSILVNGGFELFENANTKVIVLGHYRDLILLKTYR